MQKSGVNGISMPNISSIADHGTACLQKRAPVFRGVNIKNMAAFEINLKLIAANIFIHFTYDYCPSYSLMSPMSRPMSLLFLFLSDNLERMSGREIVKIQMERLRLGKYEEAEKKSLHLKNVGGAPQQCKGYEMCDNNVSGGKDNNDEYKSTLSAANAILGGDPYWQQLVGQVCLSFCFVVFALMGRRMVSQTCSFVKTEFRISAHLFEENSQFDIESCSSYSNKVVIDYCPSYSYMQHKSTFYTMFTRDLYSSLAFPFLFIEKSPANPQYQLIVHLNTARSGIAIQHISQSK